MSEKQSQAAFDAFANFRRDNPLLFSLDHIKMNPPEMHDRLIRDVLYLTHTDGFNAGVAHALSGVRNPEAVKRLIEAVREWAQTNPMTGKQRVPLENAIHAAFRELEMETKP